MPKRKSLGRGLSALFPEGAVLEDEHGFFYCPIDAISPNPHQPRQTISDSELRELANSIKEKGIIQPILVTRTKDGFQLIAGERRWRAAQKAGLDTIPAWVRDASPSEALELALVENLQRKDLNPIEEASAYQELMQRFDLTQEGLSTRIGKDRSTIANFLRLLRLPSIIQQDLIDNQLTTGHARVLVSIESPSAQRTLRDLIVKKALSVRQTESLAKKLQAPSKPKDTAAEGDRYIRSLAKDLQRSLGTKVTITKRGKKGRIVIEFYSDEELGRLIDRLS
ncbi:MAG: ParB/RepB/Spo0J family partition protein [Deltaproteobacteria bacterium]|nr:ParB/RepB/Spo0J family partition protein [Deltaproteobacteria bacterium]